MNAAANASMATAAPIELHQWVAAQHYVGTPYELGVFDCADLAVQVQREVFGRTISLPTDRPRPGGAMGQAREIKRLRAQLAEPVARPSTGCAVVFYTMDGPATPVWHVGTVFLYAGEPWVLHNSARMGSAALQRLADLQRLGLKLDGFYTWVAAPQEQAA